jgi:hypothetical protein
MPCAEGLRSGLNRNLQRPCHCNEKLIAINKIAAYVQATGTMELFCSKKPAQGGFFNVLSQSVLVYSTLAMLAHT